MVKPQRWMETLKLVSNSIVGYKVNDAELLWLTRSSLTAKDLTGVIRDNSTEGFQNQINKVKSLDLLVQFMDYVEQNLERLKSATGMLKALREQRANPSSELDVPEGISAPKNVWLFDVLCAVQKAKTKMAQGFGYSQFAKHPDAGLSRVGNMDIGTWCSCFMNQYFNINKNFTAPPEAEILVAKVLAETLNQVSAVDIEQLRETTRERFIAKEYEATLLSHRGFDPIGGLVLSTLGLTRNSVVRLPGAFAVRAGINGSGGSTTVLKTRSTLINWQSATDAGRDHKKKELCGRAVALRYTWDNSHQKYVCRPGVRRLVLVVDGTWRQPDLDALSRAGWDEIYYPDELDQLVGAII